MRRSLLASIATILAVNGCCSNYYNEPPTRKVRLNIPYKKNNNTTKKVITEEFRQLKHLTKRERQEYYKKKGKK